MTPGGRRSLTGVEVVQAGTRDSSPMARNDREVKLMAGRKAWGRTKVRVEEGGGGDAVKAKRVSRDSSPMARNDGEGEAGDGRGCMTMRNI